MVKTGEWIGEGWEIVKQDLLMHVVVVLIVSAVSSVSGGILSGVMMCGYFYILLKKIREPASSIEIGDLFKSFDVFLNAFVASLIIGAFVSVGFALCILPGIVVQALLVWAFPLIIDRRMDFWPAIQESFERTKGEWLGFSLFLLVLGLLNLAGAIVCGIGILVTAPITYAAIAVAYRDIWGLAEGEAMEVQPEVQPQVGPEVEPDAAPEV